MKKIIPFAVFITVFFSGCFLINFDFGNSAIEGSGARESYTINVGEYNGIRIEGNCEVRYYTAPSNTVTLEIQPNLREYYVVEVAGRELVVRTTRWVNHTRGNTPVLTVSTPTLNSLNISGACNFTAFDKITADSFTIGIFGAGSGKAELEVNSLYAKISGASSIDLWGRADTAELALAGAGEIKALSLQTRDAKVSFTGAGTIRISCSDNLQINAGGMGTVEYRGSPAISQNTGGLVSIRRVN